MAEYMASSAYQAAVLEGTVGIIDLRLDTGTWRIAGRFPCFKGDSAIWIPFEPARGLKLVFGEGKVNHDVLDRLRGVESPALPRLYDVFDVDIEYTPPQGVPADEAGAASMPAVALVMENCQEGPRFYSSNCSVNFPHIEECVKEFARLQLVPIDDWTKLTNMVGGRVVDCQEFRHLPERYAFDDTGFDRPALKSYVDAFVDRINRHCVANGIKPSGPPTYQGFRFRSGYEIPGYSSDGLEYDSYRKLPFVPLQGVTGKRVLELGSNLGFFPFQAAIHGAAEVTGVELLEEEHGFARTLNERFFRFDNVEFLRADLLDFVAGVSKPYDLVLLLSVIHTVFPGYTQPELDAFFARMASITTSFCFETPVYYRLMPGGPEYVAQVLQRHFRVVRLVYVYKAYKMGQRAIFFCYS
ncbi:class I SAM-dependent methyltransferase [Azospirillum thermophilum]|uniref:Methyltransferase domain-containing protein n=1 Tax=Azospirillum thermophilum TaxID=2202148 RepID=A0A2S2D0L8_9PROT|nr:class I SAM-dependent methyltransferase [Azospirillum thermophilum]AWK90238.1 hypothetical protein DEW08_29945 [Azospirillum thermophilum]